MPSRRFAAYLATVVLSILASGVARGALPPVPVPAGNPVTEPKRVLGKILFWDEQLSSDNTLACGSCHQPRYGGSAPRTGINPGPDGQFGTKDDLHGTFGIVFHDAAGRAGRDKLFGDKPQVGVRTAPSFFGGLWGDTAFWDGRAGPAFKDPISGRPVIAAGAALENQALGPIMNPIEMAQASRAWSEVTARLARATPLALARDLPPDAAAAIKARPAYPALFAAAFGDGAITPGRIAMALATYERTLVADQTPYDVAMAKGSDDYGLKADMAWFEGQKCSVCHVPPLFTNHGFANIGVRQGFDDKGRAAVTGDPRQAGAMKVPSLRNVALRPRFMHSGDFTTLDQVLDLYATPPAPADTLPDGSEYKLRMDEPARRAIKDLLQNWLTDPRVEAETYPFDRPRLRSERFTGDKTPPERPPAFRAEAAPGGLVRLAWTAPKDDTGVVDYVLSRDGRALAYLTATAFTDTAPGFGHRPGYRLIARDAAGNASVAAGAGYGLSLDVIGAAAAVLAAIVLLTLGWRRFARRRVSHAPSQ